jgi:hypothetical protein
VVIREDHPSTPRVSAGFTVSSAPSEKIPKVGGTSP